jgi:spermidine synthase
MFIASSYKGILDVGAASISQKINRQNIKVSVLLPDYLNYRLHSKWTDWFIQSSLGATKKINRDFVPFAVFEMLVFWNKQFSPGLAHLLGKFENLNLKTISVFIFIISLMVFYLLRRKKKVSIAYCIATTGFFGMLINLILIFSFQIFYGYLYHTIGILISIFMSGIAAGSIFINQKLKKINNLIRLFLRLEAAIMLLSFVLALIITKLSGYLQYVPLFFMFICFFPGFLLGLQFPLAGKIYSEEKEEEGRVAGLLYFSDLIGGWLAGIFGGIILVPVLGLFKTCMVIVIFKMSSLLLLSLKKNL